ncbi:hypothetical protein QE152_g8003 [Popillia japonica]|uniref:Uncharacterized protein n=1 Tax=Popillia japonica TaxID=7064 RepID=A0AAW1MCX2_POPJA
MSEWLEAGVIRRSSAGFNNTIILAKTKKVIDAGRVIFVDDNDVYDPKKLVNGEGPNVISTAVAYMKPWTTIIDSFDSADEPALNDEMENIGGDDSVNCFALVERNKKREEEEFVNPEKKRL